VGGQHVTFEADLKGHGEVPLSYPRAASAAIVLPPALEGKTLVEDRRASAVVAETYKAKGAAVRIAVAPGDYRILVRRDRDLLRCDVDPTGNVDMARCTTEPLVATARKGGWSGLPYRLELDGMLGGERSDAYTQSLAAFGYTDGLNASAGLQVIGLRHVAPYFWAGALISDVGLPKWTRGTGAAPQTLDWSTLTVAAVGRGELALTSERAHPQVSIYGQLAGGLGVGTTHFSGAQGENNDHTYAGLSLSGGAGLHLETRIGIGVTLGYQYSYAPAISDLFCNTHASGGHSLLAGVSYSF
jgi:hypothetical protein